MRLSDIPLLVFLTIAFRGPLISPAAKARVTSLIDSVDKEGGKIHLDGRQIEVRGVWSKGRGRESGALWSLS